VTKRRMLEYSAVSAMAFALALGLLVPAEQVQGHLSKMLFVHVPSIYLAYVAFAWTLVSSAAYLITKDLQWDRRAGASGEVGVFFTGLAILLGMVWAKPTWGVWWTWDARLVLTAVMFFVYLGYVALRRAIPDRVLRARRSAVFGMLAIVQIPIVHFSVIWWRTLHQPPSLVRPGEIQMDPPYVSALMFSLFAFTLVYLALVNRRIALSLVEEQVEDAYLAASTAVAGEAITAPTLDALELGDV
jgi:heme exporter protein C